MNIKIFKFINIVFLLIFLPYITFFKFSSDIQPWAILFGSILSLFIFINDKFILPNKYLKLILLILLSAILSFSLLSIFGLSDFISGIKSIIGYASIFIFSYIGFKTFQYINIRYFFVIIFTWLTALFIQFVFGLHIFSDFLFRVSSSGSRGFTSLAPEPAMYAFVCITLIIMNEFFFYSNKYNYKIYILFFLLLLFQIIFSYSGMGILLLFLFSLSKIIEIIFIKEEKLKKKLAIFLFLIITISVMMFSSNNILGRTRGGQVFDNFIKKPVTQIIENKNKEDKKNNEFKSKDLSVSYRIINPIVGLYGGIIKTYGLGFGVGLKEQGPIPSWLSKLLGLSRNLGGRIEGGLVQSIYELGFLGVIFNLFILFILIKNIIINKRLRPVFISSLITIFSIVFCFGSIAFPPIGYIIGIHLYYLDDHNI